jgi:hypothetical protein
LFWKKVIHGSVFNATARQLLSPREEFRLVWAESERPHLDKCAEKRRTRQNRAIPIRFSGIYDIAVGAIKDEAAG